MIYKKESNKIILVNKNNNGNYDIKIYQQKEFKFDNKQGELEFKSEDKPKNQGGWMFP